MYRTRHKFKFIYGQIALCKFSWTQIFNDIPVAAAMLVILYIRYHIVPFLVYSGRSRADIG